MEKVITKICSSCKKTKHLNDFATNKKGKYGRHSVCRTCRRISQIEYRKRTNQDRIWRAKNPDKVKEYSRKHYFKNHEKSKKYSRDKYKKIMAENPEKIRNYYRKWSKTDKGRYNSYRVQAKKRGLIFNITLDIFSKIIKKECFYCGAKNKIGIDRKDNDKGYTKENIVPCCYQCNYMKRDFTIKNFIMHCVRISKFVPTPDEVDF